MLALAFELRGALQTCPKRSHFFGFPRIRTVLFDDTTGQRRDDGEVNGCRRAGLHSEFAFGSHLRRDASDVAFMEGGVFVHRLLECVLLVAIMRENLPFAREKLQFEGGKVF